MDDTMDKIEMEVLSFLLEPVRLKIQLLVDKVKIVT